jgi:hypothetical protein
MFMKYTVFVLVTAALVGGCTRGSEDAQTIGLTELQKLGAAVDVDDNGQVTFVNLSHQPVTDDELECLEKLTNLRQLWLYDTNITDQGLRHLSGLVNLEVLVLGKTRITDRGLPQLHPLKKLQELYVYETDTSAQAMASLHQVLTKTVIVQ